MIPENIHTHPKEGHWKFRGGGASQKVFKGKYEAKLEIQEEWGEGCQNQKTFRVGMDIFWNHTKVISSYKFPSVVLFKTEKRFIN